MIRQINVQPVQRKIDWQLQTCSTVEPESCNQTIKNLAEKVGFEPTEGLHLRLISNQVHSTTLPPLQTSARVDGEWAEIYLASFVLATSEAE